MRGREGGRQSPDTVVWKGKRGNVIKTPRKETQFKREIPREGDSTLLFGDRVLA